MQGSLFDDTEVTTKKKRERHVHYVGGWEFTDHACRHCFGRILRMCKPNGVVVTRCAECDYSATGDVEKVCWCGSEVHGHGFIFECFRNPNITPSNPQVILVREKPLVKAQILNQVRRSNPVKINGY